MEKVEYCPRCKKSIAIIITESEQRRMAPDGRVWTVLVRQQCCVECHGLLRTEELPHASARQDPSA